MIGIYKNDSGYFKREELDLMMSGCPSPKQNVRTEKK